MRLLRRLWYLVRQRGADAALAEEIELHRELTERHLERQGLTSTEAGVEARRRLGNATLVRDDARDVWGWSWLQDIWQDVRFAARLLAKDRRFTVAVVLALGLGIGVNNSVFSVVNTALIRQVPFDRPDRLLDLGVINRDGREVGLSYPDYRDWMEATTLEGIAVSVNAVMNLSDDELAPERLRGTYISANTFSLLRSKPLLGRDFQPEDDRAGAPPVVVIGYRVWQGRYGGDPSVIGRTVRINSVAATLVGVMPANFAFPFIAEAWQPLSLASGLEAGRRNARPFREVIARLADTADLARAQAEVAAIASGLAQSFPDTNADLRPTLKLMKDGLGGRQAKPILMTLMGAVALVLLIACANVANLLLARAATRSREIAIRASLGATRWRIVRALLVECLMLAVLAGGVGIACSLYGARALAVGFSVIEPGAPSGALMPYWVDLSVDKMVLAFVGTACLFSTLVFGLVPAVQAAKVDVNGALKEGGRGGTSGGRARRWTSVFIIAEVALTVVLLVGAGLLWRSFYARYRTDLVVNTSGLITARLTLPVDKYDTSDKRQRFFEQLQERLAGGPAFSSVAIASAAPLSPDVASRQLAIEGSPTPSGVKAPTVSYVYTGTRYFETLGIQVRRGRLFTEGDGLPGRETAIVDDRCAALYFPGADPIGQRIRLTEENPSGARQPWLTIVGVTPALPDFRPSRLRSPVVLRAHARGAFTWSGHLDHRSRRRRRRGRCSTHPRAGPCARSGAADLRCRANRGGGGARPASTTAHRRFIRCHRAHRAGALDDGRLRADGIRRGAANPGNRREDGARSAGAAGHVALPPQNHDPSCRRSRARRFRCAGHRPVAAVVSCRDERARSPHARHCRGTPGGRSHRCELDPVAARRASRPDGRVAVGVG